VDECDGEGDADADGVPIIREGAEYGGFGEELRRCPGRARGAAQAISFVRSSTETRVCWRCDSAVTRVIPRGEEACRVAGDGVLQVCG